MDLSLCTDDQTQSPPAAPLTDSQTGDLDSLSALQKFEIKEPALSFSLIPDNSTSQPFKAIQSTSEGLMELDGGLSSDHSEAPALLRSLSHQSDSFESDMTIAPVSDLYIFESETHDFILSPNVDPEEITCPEYPPLSQIGGEKTDLACDTNVLRCDSENVVTQCHHSSDCESDVSQRTRLMPPAVDACETGLVSVNDAGRRKAEVTDVTPQPRQSDSPIELWLDACQYLAGEDLEDKSILDKMQGGLMVTRDLSFPARETQVSCYSPDGSERIGWAGDDTGGWGPPVERWSSVDSWASALSDWTGIITAPPEDFTAAFTEIGAEIDALTQAIAEESARIGADTSKEGVGQEPQSQPLMGVQDHPLKAQSIPESSVISGQRCLSLCLDSAGSELRDRVGSQSVKSLCDSSTQGEKEPEEIQSSQAESLSMGSSGATVASPGGYGGSSSAGLDLSHFGGYVESFETDIFLSNEEDPIILNIVEDTDLEGQNKQAELIIEEPFADGLCEVTNEHSISQLGSAAEQEAKRNFCPVAVDCEETECSTELRFLTTHTPTDSHVPGVDTQPALHINAHTHVPSDNSPDIDGACQLEPKWGSPKFIMPLAPLGLGSSLVCRTSCSLEGDQTCAKRSLNDNRDLSCGHKQPCVLWQTSDGIFDKPSLDGDEELIHKKENTTDSSEKSSAEGQLDLDTTEHSFTVRKTVIEDINDLSRELSNLADVPADNFIISEETHVAVITLDLNDPFVTRVAKPIATVVKPELNQKPAEKMPHKTHKSKKDKSAGHHHGAQASKKQENLSHHVSGQQVCKQQEQQQHPLAGENHTGENTPAALEDKEAKLVIETGVAAEKAPSKPHGKKKKKHAQNVTGVKSAGEPLAEVENGAKPQTAKGRIDLFEAKLGANAQKESDQSHGAEKKSQQPQAKATLPPHHTDHKDHQPKDFTSPLKDDIIKKRRLSEDKFGKIVSALESKLTKPDVSNKAKGEEPKVDAGATRKKAYSEVVKQKIPPKEEPKVVKPIQAEAVSGDPQSLCLWCQFAAVLSHYTVTWCRDGTVLAEIKRSAGDESRVSLTISNASHKDLGKYQCRLTSLHGSVSLDYLLTYEVLSEIVIPPTPKAIPSAPVEVGSEEEDVRCSRLMFKEDFLSDQYFGENQPASIITEKVHFGEGMHRRAFRTKLRAGQIPLLLPGHPCVLKVHNSISYGTKNNEELIQKNFTLAVEECQVQNTAREYIKAYTTAAQSVEAYGQIPEIIPIYLVHRPSNDIPYATLEEELIGNFVKYSVKDGKEINLMRRDSEAGQKCCAFQHWVYQKTDGNLLVTDMQGVGMKLTDVGIATCKKGYKGFKGNCATSFIDQFKALHQCNRYCELLGLKSLQPKAKKPASAPKPKPQPSAAPKKKTFGPTVKGKS
ncbi:alpha-protein kinase 2 [Symphorus nematophorus]